uniref:Uncharacterized protein n=1 Tax=Vitis vinifera TaxID=29760 RepID=A5BBU6_VITVI|nr:hypothetical protein VITISV_039216 [Vitis vinifera]
MSHLNFATVGHVFEALSGAQIMHTISCFKAWEVRSPELQTEVKNPMLQTVHDSELKRRSYSHCKKITPKCCEISLLLREFRSLFVQSYGIPPEATRYIPQVGTLRTSRWKPISQHCEFNLLLRKYFAALLSVCEISQTPFSPAKWSLVLPDIFAPTLLDIFLQIFLYEFPFFSL